MTTGTGRRTGVHAELLLDARACLGEGPSWHGPEQVLDWVDIEGKAVHTLDPVTGEEHVVQLDQKVSAVVRTAAGGAVAAMEGGLADLDLATGEYRVFVADPEPDLAANRLNDGKCDSAGRLWVGTSPSGADFTPDCSLYRLDTDRSLHRVVQGVRVSNGLGWSPDDRTMYYVDTATMGVDAFDFDAATGDLGNRRRVVSTVDMGFPDGLSVDAEGLLWVAQFGAGVINRWDPETGRLAGTVHVPVPTVTSCCFGGPDLDQLFITSGWLSLSPQAVEEHPTAGGVFVADVGVRGLPVQPFAG